MVDVLVPRYGVQSIHRSKIREEGSSRLSAGISCLVLRFDADDEDVSTSALIPLLKVVGKNLKQLTILLDVESEVDSCRIELCDILRACPRLEVLKIQGLHVTDISQLSGYMDNNDCALSVLEFNKIERDSDDKIEDFLKAFEDSSKRVSQQLRELLIEPRNSAISSTLQHRVQKMLEANRTLGLFVLGVSPKHHSAYERALTQALPTVYLPVVHKSFPLRSKLGFISVVHAPCNGSHALSRLDSRALSSIFRFAALPQKRAVHVFRSDRAYESGSE
ncbi:hypothetical protein Poli38472_011211 [Pythium oligandrum]|uniref:Uncharacterized protein n=1 Tax=Pythium oligandrum TaxID=41045 RepID=A0A8K1FLW7_PYTOL|nr:hypothetical protein Poli38472_011211 [Pythium oligandrum]|eukprot:TMW67591.1 hypothetical protein Poli38472_011211 [Pythium oligandrum]